MCDERQGGVLHRRATQEARAPPATRRSGSRTRRVEVLHGAGSVFAKTVGDVPRGHHFIRVRSHTPPHFSDASGSKVSTKRVNRSQIHRTGIGERRQHLPRATVDQPPSIRRIRTSCAVRARGTGGIPRDGRRDRGAEGVPDLPRARRHAVVSWTQPVRDHGRRGQAQGPRVRGAASGRLGPRGPAVPAASVQQAGERVSDRGRRVQRRGGLSVPARPALPHHLHGQGQTAKTIFRAVRDGEARVRLGDGDAVERGTSTVSLSARAASRAGWSVPISAASAVPAPAIPGVCAACASPAGFRPEPPSVRPQPGCAHGPDRPAVDGPAPRAPPALRTESHWGQPGRHRVRGVAEPTRLRAGPVVVPGPEERVAAGHSGAAAAAFPAAPDPNAIPAPARGDDERGRERDPGHKDEPGRHWRAHRQAGGAADVAVVIGAVWLVGACRAVWSFLAANVHSSAALSRSGIGG